MKDVLLKLSVNETKVDTESTLHWNSNWRLIRLFVMVIFILITEWHQLITLQKP